MIKCTAECIDKHFYWNLYAMYLNAFVITHLKWSCNLEGYILKYMKHTTFKYNIE